MTDLTMWLSQDSKWTFEGAHHVVAWKRLSAEPYDFGFVIIDKRTGERTTSLLAIDLIADSLGYFGVQYHDLTETQRELLTD